MRVLVTGGCGYKGSVLVPKLLAQGYQVRVVDTQWFGKNLLEHPMLEVFKDDIRGDTNYCAGVDAVIHLAGIANDPCGELDAKLTWEVNVLATMRLVEQALRSRVKRFIFASSASVYGIGPDNKEAIESDRLTPISDYNKTKMVAERVLLSYADYIDIRIIRPATVCGMSPRMRLDTVVNMLTSQAISKGTITMHCGLHGAALMRPNIHIQDVADLYCRVLSVPDSWPRILNAGFENLSVENIANLIQWKTGAKLDVTEVADKRSYCVSSDALLSLGFKPRYTVRNAVCEIIAAYHNGSLVVDERAVNLTWMRKNGWVKA